LRAALARITRSTTMAAGMAQLRAQRVLVIARKPGHTFSKCTAASSAAIENGQVLIAGHGVKNSDKGGR
jgi:hypothetical protein